MVWKKLFRQDDTANRPDTPSQAEPGPPAEEPVPPPIPGARLPGSAAASGSRTLPPHMQRAVQERKRTPGSTDPQQRLARLRQQRLAILFDVDQGELAEEDENPWSHRIALLTEAMETVNADLASLAAAAPAPTWPVLPVPITGITATDGPPFALSMTIGNESFTWEESLDWAERGHQISLPELTRTQGRVEAIVPADAPDDIRPALTAHLAQSVDAFAADLREHRLNGDPLPARLTLTDLAKPSPRVGGWLDWAGRSAVQAVRAAEELRLRRERDRLLSERSREAEERHRLVERLPIARRRLADVDAEIAAAEASLAQESSRKSAR